MVKRNGASDGDDVRSDARAPSRSAGSARGRGSPISRQGSGSRGRDIAQLRPSIDSLAASGLPFYVVPDVQTGDYVAEDSLTRGARFLSQLRIAHPWLVMHSLDGAVDRLRAKKSAAEIALLRQAVRDQRHGRTGRR